MKAAWDKKKAAEEADRQTLLKVQAGSVCHMGQVRGFLGLVLGL